MKEAARGNPRVVVRAVLFSPLIGLGRDGKLPLLLLLRVQPHDRLLPIHVPKLWLFDYLGKLLFILCGETETRGACYVFELTPYRSQ